MRFFSVVRFIPLTPGSPRLLLYSVPALVRLSLRPSLGRYLGHVLVPATFLGKSSLCRLRGGRPAALAQHPLLDVTLGSCRDRQRAGRHVPADDGPAAGDGAVADVDRRDERVVGPRPGVAAHRRTVLLHAVVVG